MGVDSVLSAVGVASESVFARRGYSRPALVPDFDAYKYAYDGLRIPGTKGGRITYRVPSTTDSCDRDVT